MQIRLSEILRELRHKNGITQDMLAQALGVTSQAVSRWEKNICYPDMELLPSLANYFGISIDELFGYDSQRDSRINELAKKITAMNRENNGVDVSMDACIQLAREALAEFPGNETLLCCLASALYNAGYVRYGEYSLTDGDGYSIFDTERHKSYGEWQESIRIYEKVLPSLPVGEMRYHALTDLLQLYANTGETEKAAALADTTPEFAECRELLRINACTGKNRAAAYGDAVLAAMRVCSNLMLSSVMVSCEHISSGDSVRIIENAIRLYELVFQDGDYGIYHGELIQRYLYLSEHLWRDGRKDEAFGALDKAWEHGIAYEKHCKAGGKAYTSPLLRLVQQEPIEPTEVHLLAGLPDDWPWWFDFAYSSVKAEIQADPRWAVWVEKTKRT